MKMDFENLNNLVLEKLSEGNNLLSALKRYQELDGIQKLERKIKQEIAFLKKIQTDQNIKKEHLQCSNLTHFRAVVETLQQVDDRVSVNKPFNLNGKKVTVDIVCDGGLTWMKTVARNHKSLSQISMGDTEYGVRSILDQAQEFLQCAKSYPILFQTPQIIFVFANGIGESLALNLESLGVVVKGKRIDDKYVNGETHLTSTSELSMKSITNIKKANLDVSAMLAYVSSVTNGSCRKYKFSVPVLAQQAQWECERPVKPVLEEYFKDKKLYCCETAQKSFVEIVNTVGGSSEKLRAEDLLKRITVLPDDASACDTDGDKTENSIFDNVQFTPDKVLNVGGKIRGRSLIIFTFGDRIQAVTVTANDGFVRAAKQQGINFAVFVHESRALTEQKESKADLITKLN